MSHLKSPQSLRSYSDIHLLFDHNLVQAPLSIRAEVGEAIIDASLLLDGSVLIKDQSYPSINMAMSALNPLSESTSDAWQFWGCYSDERGAWTPLEHLRAKFASMSKTSDAIKTSASHPLRIDTIAIPSMPGQIGLTFCPGKCTHGLYGGIWERDLTSDVEALVAWGAKTLISLMELHEFSLLGVPEFADFLSKNKTLRWLHLPIKDMQIPDAVFENQWQSARSSVIDGLKAGESIVIHCRGGLGRTGLLAARILVELGFEPAELLLVFAKHANVLLKLIVKNTTC